MKSPTADPMLATYTAREVARLLGLSRQSVYAHAADIPGGLRIGTRLVFSQRVIDDWL